MGGNAPLAILLQLRVLCLGLLQDEDVGVGVFPEREEVLVCVLCFGCVAVHCVGSSKLKMRERAQREVHHETRTVENLLELSRGVVAPMKQQVRLATQIDRIHRSWK